MNKIVLLFGEQKVGKSCFIQTLTQTKMIPVQTKQVEITKFVRGGLNYQFIDSFSKTSNFLDDDYSYVLQTQLEDKHEVKQNNYFIDSILLFQSVSESTIQIQLTLQFLKEIFPFLRNENFIVVITKWERSSDQKKLENLKTSLTNQKIPFIQWVNSCSTLSLNNEEYQKSILQQTDKLFELMQNCQRIQLRQGNFSRVKLDQIATKLEVSENDYEDICQQFGFQIIKISNLNEQIKIYVLIGFCILAMIAQLTYGWQGTVVVMVMVLLYNLFIYFENQQNQKKKEERSLQIRKLSEKKIMLDYKEQFNKFLKEENDICIF